MNPSLCVKARKLIIAAINKMTKTRNDYNGMPGTRVPWMDLGLPGHRTLACLYGKLTVTPLYDKHENNLVSGINFKATNRHKRHIQAASQAIVCIDYLV
jgi:hypothetical protein